MKKLSKEQLKAILERDLAISKRHFIGISVERFHELTVKIAAINKALGLN